VNRVPMNLPPVGAAPFLTVTWCPRLEETPPVLDRFQSLASHARDEPTGRST